MKRPLLMLGSVLSIVGAVGLMVFSRAVVGVFEGVLTYLVVNPPEPLPSSLGELGWVTFSGIALTFGLVISGVATVLRDSQMTKSLAAKILHAMAGFMVFIGTLPLLWSLLVARRGFIIIATSPVTPKPEDARAMVEAAAPMLTAGCAALLVGSVVLLVAGQVGFRARPSRTTSTRSVFGVLAATGVMLLGSLAAFLFFGVWIHGSALEALLANTELTPKPTELARHLMGILNKSSLAFILVGCQGILHILAAIFVPSPQPDAATQA